MFIVLKLTSICILCFSSTTVEPAARFSVESVRLSTPPFQSLASRRKCVCVSRALSYLTSECPEHGDSKWLCLWHYKTCLQCDADVCKWLFCPTYVGHFVHHFSLISGCCLILLCHCKPILLLGFCMETICRLFWDVFIRFLKQSLLKLDWKLSENM